MKIRIEQCSDNDGLAYKKAVEEFVQAYEEEKDYRETCLYPCVKLVDKFYCENRYRERQYYVYYFEGKEEQDI